jgi:hypothetical protein
MLNRGGQPLDVVQARPSRGRSGRVPFDRNADQIIQRTASATATFRLAPWPGCARQALRQMVTAMN